MGLFSGTYQYTGAGERAGSIGPDLQQARTFQFRQSRWTRISAVQRIRRFLIEYFREAQKSIWDIDGMCTKSRHFPGVHYAGLIHPGLIGRLPDRKMLDVWNTREKALFVLLGQGQVEGGLPGRRIEDFSVCPSLADQPLKATYLRLGGIRAACLAGGKGHPFSPDASATQSLSRRRARRSPPFPIHRIWRATLR